MYAVDDPELNGQSVLILLEGNIFGIALASCTQAHGVITVMLKSVKEWRYHLDPP
jgi:hypothetical protein